MRNISTSIIRCFNIIEITVFLLIYDIPLLSSEVANQIVEYILEFGDDLVMCNYIKDCELCRPNSPTPII